MRRFIIVAVTAALAMAVSAPIRADEEKSQPQKPKIEVVNVKIHPAAVPTLALKHRLLPSYIDTTPGNAAPLYMKAMLFLMEKMANDDFKLICKWAKEPLDAIPMKEARKIINKYDSEYYGALRQVAVAARRERCEWDPPTREGNVYDIMLPEIQHARNIAWLLALKIRLQVAEKKYSEAVASLQIGYCLGRDIAKMPFMVSGLAAVAITNMMDYQVLTFIQQSDAPNLYWSLTALPKPFINPRKSLEFECDSLYLTLPLLTQVRQGDATPKQCEHLLELLVGSFVETGKENEDSAIASEVKNFLIAAKNYLIAEGVRSKKEVEAMSDSQIGLLCFVTLTDLQRDILARWINVPYWQLPEEDALILKAPPPFEKVTVDSWFTSTRAYKITAARAEKQIEVLRCIEALRLYAAGHDGRLPASLDEIKEVPIPLNPMTGKPFSYHLDGATAILDADGKPDWSRRQYRIEVAK